MPKAIPFEWQEDSSCINFVFHIPGVTSEKVDILISDLYVKVNSPPHFFDADLFSEIDPTHPNTRAKIGAGQLRLRLRKREPKIWRHYRVTNLGKEDIIKRRELALSQAETRQQEEYTKRSEFRTTQLKAGEKEQWRLDHENRRQIEKWKEEEAELAAQYVYESFECGELKKGEIEDVEVWNRTGQEQTSIENVGGESAAVEKMSPSGTSDRVVLEAVEDSREPAVQTALRESPGPAPEELPDIRDHGGKIAMKFTERRTIGVPARDRPGLNREPPHPKNVAARPRLAGEPEGDEHGDETDPVWLKDKGDEFCTRGDYAAGVLAYTKALKIASHAKCFANRALCHLHLGNLGVCVEDCNNAISVLNLRNRAPAGSLGALKDPEEQVMRAKIEVRLGVAYLWMGEFKKSLEHMKRSLEVEDGFTREDEETVRHDIDRIAKAWETAESKAQADMMFKRALGKGVDHMERALEQYDKVVEADKENAVVLSNRSQCRLQLAQYQGCLEDSAVAMQSLTRWPAARRAPRPPARPSRMEPPFLEDHTFVNPHMPKKDEPAWLMKQEGVAFDALPDLPKGWEWVKNAEEKAPDAWIAIKKKLSKIEIDLIRETIQELQDALYSRNPNKIDAGIAKAKQLILENKPAPSSAAVKQAIEYNDKLKKHLEEKEKHKQEVDAELRAEMDLPELTAQLVEKRHGAVVGIFPRGHPIQKSRRRLLAKLRLRRSTALAALGKTSAAIEELLAVLSMEPANAAAQAALAKLTAETGDDLQLLLGQGEVLQSDPDPHVDPSGGQVVVDTSDHGQSSENAKPVAWPRVATYSAARPPVSQKSDEKDFIDLDDLEDNDDVDSPERTAALIDTATQYLKKGDFASSLQMYRYALNKPEFPSHEAEVKCYCNMALCLQKLRRNDALESAATRGLQRIAEVRELGSIPEKQLAQLEAALLSRRGWARIQLGKTELGEADAKAVKQMVAAANPP
mmetsp:Transcript_15664/g.37736  ORF Transcript_15664/g.37736 Transcript_15664/m.37736 type:complete len:972 (+) Transcript_15664:59-2974(+)